jgi:hypothetical protein
VESLTKGLDGQERISGPEDKVDELKHAHSNKEKQINYE